MITRQNIPLHVGEVGIGFAPATFGGAGGTPPYNWSIGGGSLAPGLNISPGGTVSGTPTANGTFGFTLLLSDSVGAAAGYATSVTILPRLAASGLCTQLCSVEAGCTTVCGAFGDISGGVQPYAFALTTGSFPAGMSLNGLTLAGTFPAPPPTGAAPPPYNFTVGLTDSLGATASVSAVFSVFSHIAMQGGTIGVSPQTLCFWTGAPSSAGCTVNFPYFGGTPNGTPTASAKWVSPYPQSCTANPPTPPPSPCPFPPMPTITVGGGNVTIAVPPGGQTWFNGYTATLQVVLTDQSPCAPGPVNCTSTPVNITITQQGG